MHLKLSSIVWTLTKTATTIAATLILMFAILLTGAIVAGKHFLDEKTYKQVETGFWGGLAALLDAHMQRQIVASDIRLDIEGRPKLSVATAAELSSLATSATKSNKSSMDDILSIRGQALVCIATADCLGGDKKANAHIFVMARRLLNQERKSGLAKSEQDFYRVAALPGGGGSPLWFIRNEARLPSDLVQIAGSLKRGQLYQFAITITPLAAAIDRRIEEQDSAMAIPHIPEPKQSRRVKSLPPVPVAEH